jgi:uncharacterized membrane protein YgcG
MRVLTVLGSLLAVAALTLLGPLAAHADDPVNLGGAYVLDDAGVLSTSGQGQVKSALDSLYAKTGAQLFVVLVPTFTGADDEQAWADQTATLSGLGESDALLAISVNTRVFRYSVGQTFPLTNAQLDQLASDDLIPHLRSNDWTGGLVAFANGMSDTLSGGGFPIVPVAIGGVVVVGAGVGIGVAVFRRRKKASAAPPDQLDQKQLTGRAGTLLVQLDDALKTSEQEIGFAQAQFGDDATKEFATVLDGAKKQVAQAFTLQQQLDDATPETDEQKRTMTLQIIQLCQDADTALDAQTETFDQLRQLEQNAPQLIESLAAADEALGSRIDAAETAIKDLSTRFGTAGVTSVSGTVAQARKLAAFAKTAIGDARTAIAAQKNSDAAIAVRGAQQAVGQVEQLLAAVDRLGSELPALSERLAAAVDDTRSDIAEAKAVPTTGAAASAADSATITAAATEAERVLGTVPQRDPATALADVEKTNTQLNAALAQVRDRQTQIARAQSMLTRSSDSARSNIAAVQDYITTRRGSVGSPARTRIVEAQRHLDQATSLAASDPVAALAEAQQADSMAASALSLAQSDVGGYVDSDSYSAGNSGSFGGAVLGGILGGLLSGGGGSSRPSSGPSWGSGGGGWSGSRPGGFGGSHGSSGGSRPSSSGGRRGGGGRF